jgi:hypothetical protein
MSGGAMPTLRRFSYRVVGLIAVGSLLGLSACAPEPDPTPEPSATATAAPETPEPAAYDGPLVFVGDQLDWLLLSADEVAGIVPTSAEFAEPSASLVQISDGWGAEITPEICSVLLMEASLGSVGARTLTWQAENDHEGRLSVLQFPTPAQAERRMDDYVDAAEQCSEFTFNQGASSFANALIDEDGVRSVAGSVIIGDSAEGWKNYYGIASVGNVLVEFTHSFTGESALDPEAAARALHDRLRQARDLLVGDLTANPPTSPAEPPAVDVSAAWADWPIDFGGVGPLRLGEDIDAAVATVPGAGVSAEEWSPNNRMLTSADGSARVQITAQEKGTAVATILVGKVALYGEPPVDGTGLPRADGVGIGDPIENAMTAFPEGTSVRVISAALHFYEVSTREGEVLLFHTDRDIATPGATIIGITAEDGTLRRELYIGAHLE